MNDDAWVDRESLLIWSREALSSVSEARQCVGEWLGRMSHTGQGIRAAPGQSGLHFQNERLMSIEGVLESLVKKIEHDCRASELASITDGRTASDLSGKDNGADNHVNR